MNKKTDKQTILEHLDKQAFYGRFIPSLKETGKDQAQGLCPFHNDHNPSLSVNLKDGLYNCFSCGAKGNFFQFYQDLKKVDFPTALKEIADMQGITETQVKQKVVAKFEYKDVDGKTRYIKERLEPGRHGRDKDFRFKNHLTGKNERGCEPVLYNLLELINSKYAVILEGEGKVELLKEWGLVATCLDSGANSPWKAEYTKVLQGKEKVVILPDNDTPGRSYASKIANALNGRVGSLKVVELPGLEEAEDVIDWSKREGNGKAKLLELIKEAPEWESTEEPDARELEEPETQEEALVFPDSAWRGVFGTYSEAMISSTWASKVTHFITLWAVIATLLRRKVKFHYGLDLYPNCQIVYYGITNDKKTTATSKFKPFFADNPGIKVLQGIGSGEGLTDWLKSEDMPKTHFLYCSEFSEISQKGSWQGSTLKTAVTQIYDCPDMYEAPFRKDPIKIKEPTLTILACTTPTWFWKDITELDIHSGFANRFSFFTGDPGEPIARPKRPSEDQINKVRKHIEEAIKALPADTLELDFDPQAAKLWDEFYPEWVNEKWSSELVNAGVKRVDGYIIKLSMVYAVMEGTTPYITYDQLKAAFEVGYYSAKCTERLISKHQLKSRAGRLEERIINQLEQGTNTRRQLQKGAGTNFDCTVFNKTLDSMVRANRIYERAGKRSNTWEYSLK